MRQPNGLKMNKEKFNSFVAIWCYLIIFSIIFIFWNSVVDERIDKLEQKISSSYVDRDTLENILNNLIYKNGTCNIDTYKQEECQENTAFRCVFWGDWVWEEILDGRAQEKCRTINKTQTTTLSESFRIDVRCSNSCSKYKERLLEKKHSGSPYDICMQNCLYNEINITIPPNYPTTTIPLPPTTTTTIPDELCCTSNYEGIYMIGSPIRFWIIEVIQNNITEFLCVDCGDIPKLEGFSTDKILNMSPKIHPLIELRFRG